jgi:AMME syndrome candidate gene 1 protein
MCYHCFVTLTEELQGKQKNTSWRPFRAGSKRPIPEYIKDLSDPSTECPLFITWDKLRPKAGFPSSLILRSDDTAAPIYELRGCIGSLSPKPLMTSIRDYALNSAMRDRRFQPITDDEIPNLRVAVSLLVKYENCDHCLDWDVGKHGILIRFWGDKSARDYSATYLPEVAKEQGWDQKEAVTALVRKSGYPGKVDQELLDKIRCTRYQSSKRHMTYDEFVSAQKLRSQQCNSKSGEGESPPSTEPSSASSSFHHKDVEEGDSPELSDFLADPVPKWNPCNNL